MYNWVTFEYNYFLNISTALTDFMDHVNIDLLNWIEDSNENDMVLDERVTADPVKLFLNFFSRK